MNAWEFTGIIEVGIFARTPALGQVKQRLAKDIGAENALRVYCALFDHTLKSCIRAHRLLPPLTPRLWYTGETPTAFLPPSFEFATQLQPGHDFGSNMQAVIDRIHEPGISAVMIIGSDHPELSAAHLIDMASNLIHSQVSIGPTEDGGFWALATRIALPDIFSDMTFSTPTVYDELIERLDARGISHTPGATLFDVDDIRSLARMKKNPLHE